MLATQGFLTVGGFFDTLNIKKIFSVVLRMDSIPYTKNEIRASTDEICYADEIFGYASDEIKSTHPPSRQISSNEVGFHRRRRFHPPARVDLVEKKHRQSRCFFLPKSNQTEQNRGKSK